MFGSFVVFPGSMDNGSVLKRNRSMFFPLQVVGHPKKKSSARSEFSLMFLGYPPGNLTYPTLGKGKSSSNMFDGIC